MKSAYYNPTRRLFGNDAFKCLPDFVREFQPKKILLVLGKNSFRRSAHYAVLKDLLSPWTVIETEAVGENPFMDFAESLSASYRGSGIDLVIGLGGGSVIDVAKIAAVLIRNPEGALKRYVDSKQGFDQPSLPLIAIPTTAGTGSEVTPYASLETSERKKITVTHPSLFPALALMDPFLTHSMPPSVTASTGFDALSQAIEAFWSVEHSPFSDGHAVRAAGLVMKHLRQAVHDPADVDARYGMALGSCESGLAIAYTATTAVHSVSYPLTTLFGIPHGHACALTLAEFIRFNADSMQEKRYEYLWRAMGVRSVEEAAAGVERLMKETGLEQRLSKLGIQEKDIETILQNAFRPDRVKKNPKPLTVEALRNILSKIF